jgi:hypothetical protein
VLFPSFDFNIFVDLRCGVSVFYGRCFSTVFLTVPVLVPPKGFVVRSFFASDFIRRATPSCAQISDFPSRNFDLSSSTQRVVSSVNIHKEHYRCHKIKIRGSHVQKKNSLKGGNHVQNKKSLKSCVHLFVTWMTNITLVLLSSVEPNDLKL